jgi:hypothetical protein
MSKHTSDGETPFFTAETTNLQLAAIIYQNGLFVSISKNETLLLGTMALSLPVSQTIGISRRREESFDRRGLTTATVIGSRNEIYAKALAEKLTVNTGNMVYLSLNFKENDENLYGEAIELVDSLLQYINENKQSI